MGQQRLESGLVDLDGERHLAGALALAETVAACGGGRTHHRDRLRASLMVTHFKP